MVVINDRPQDAAIIIVYPAVMTSVCPVGPAAGKVAVVGVCGVLAAAGRSISAE
jgi:hypothetical protein